MFNEFGLTFYLTVRLPLQYHKILFHLKLRRQYGQINDTLTLRKQRYFRATVVRKFLNCTIKGTEITFIS